jgi:hypothetical protein
MQEGGFPIQYQNGNFYHEPCSTQAQYPYTHNSSTKMAQSPRPKQTLNVSSNPRDLIGNGEFTTHPPQQPLVT